MEERFTGDSPVDHPAVPHHRSNLSPLAHRAGEGNASQRKTTSQYSEVQLVIIKHLSSILSIALCKRGRYIIHFSLPSLNVKIWPINFLSPGRRCPALPSASEVQSLIRKMDRLLSQLQKILQFRMWHHFRLYSYFEMWKSFVEIN